MIELTNLPINITKQVNLFTDFLVKSWSSLSDLMDDHDWDDDGDFTSDWMQVNWEFLVERELIKGQGFLTEIEWSARVTYPQAKATHKVICKVKDPVILIDWIKKTENHEGEDLILEGFLTPVETSFGLYPPFDYADIRTIDNKKIYRAPLNQCQFYITSI